jgi:hypothetical protein
MSDKEYIEAIREWNESYDEEYDDHEMIHPDCLTIIEHRYWVAHDKHQCKKLNIPIEDEIVRCDFSRIDARRLNKQLKMICPCPECQPNNFQTKLAELQEKYNELIMAVETKFPNESRHETALRYIKSAELGSLEASRSYER